MREGWEYKKLGEVCEINYGTRVVQKKDKGSTYYVYGGGGATFMVDSYNREDCFIVARFAMSPKCTRFVKGKFFLNDSGLSVSTKMEGLSQGFVDKALMANNDKIYAMSKGAAQRNLDMSAFRNLSIPVPPLSEQQRIVSELDLLTSIIDKQKAQLNELDTLAQSIFYDMFGDPVENEKGWEVKKLENCVEKNKYALKAGPFGSALKKEYYVPSGYKIYGQEQVISNDVNYGSYYIDEIKYNELKSFSIKFDDVLISLVGTFGKLLIIPKYFQEGIINPRLVKISFDKDIVNTTYFKYFFTSDSLKEYLNNNSHGQTMGILNLSIIKSIPLIVPPLSLQQSFAAKIEAIEKQKAAISSSLAETQKLFDYTMDKYFG